MTDVFSIFRKIPLPLKAVFKAIKASLFTLAMLATRFLESEFKFEKELKCSPFNTILSLRDSE